MRTKLHKISFPFSSKSFFSSYLPRAPTRVSDQHEYRQEHNYFLFQINLSDSKLLSQHRKQTSHTIPAYNPKHPRFVPLVAMLTKIKIQILTTDNHQYTFQREGFTVMHMWNSIQFHTFRSTLILPNAKFILSPFKSGQNLKREFLNELMINKT